MHTLMTALAVVGTVGLATSVRARPLTLDQALDRATRRPSVRLATLDVASARADARGAALPTHDPQLSAGGGPRLGAGRPELQIELALSQTFELGGKRSARIEVADARTRAIEIARDAELLSARVEAWRAFEHVLLARDRVATRREVEHLATTLATAIQRGAAAGGTTELRANVAVAEAGRAASERTAAQAELATARARLATAIGAGPAEPLDVTGEVVDPPALRVAIDRLVERALRTHPAATIADQRLAVARARVTDADARGAPDLTVGLGYAYDPDPDGAHVVVGTLSIPLAIRNRNQGERAAARIGAKRADLERSYTRLEIERAVRLAVGNYRRARAAVAGFDRGVLEQLGRNLAAAQDAYSKGGLDFVELTATKRELIASRIAYLDARLALIDAWADLAVATGMEVSP